MELDTKIITQEITRVCPDYQAIYLFGSHAAGNVRIESDIDLAILAPRSLPVKKLWDLRQNLAIQLNKDVDLIDLRATTTVMAFQIVINGQRISTTDRYTAELYESHIFSDYVNLNERRAEILQDIKQRGSIYG